MSDTTEMSPAVEAWVAGDMQGAQALNQPISDDAPAAPSGDVQPWLKNNLAIQQIRDDRQAQTQARAEARTQEANAAMITSAASKLTELGPLGASLVQEWGGHTSPDFKANLEYAHAVFADVVKNRPDLIEKVDASGLGSDPAVLKILSELGRQRANMRGDNTVNSRRFNDEPSRPLPSGGSAAQRELDQIYKNTPPGSEGYRTREVQTRVQELNEMIHGTGPAVGMGGRTY